MKIYKYFLLHNKKLKPWIKYWLYIKSKVKQIVNLFNKDTILPNHLINSNGTITEDAYNFVSDYIEVTGETNYTIKADTNKAKRIAYYDRRKTFMRRPVVNEYEDIILIPTGTFYVRLSCHNDDLNSLEFFKT